MSIEKYFDENLPQFKTQFFGALEFPRRTTLRVNTLKITKNDLLQRLRAKGFELMGFPGMPDALICTSEDTPVSKTIEHFLGLFYIQSAASMLPPTVLNPNPGEFILDISSAPGSKTTQIAQLLNNRGAIIANDWDGQRIKILAHNIDRMGIHNSAMVNMGGERIGNLLPETFDKILVDAPCSSLGVLYKAAKAVDNLKYLGRFAYIQEQLLMSAIKALRVGGEIIYSTCTISLEENEYVLNAILSKYPVRLDKVNLPPSIMTADALSLPGQADLSLARRVLPSELNPEGFFIARIVKTGPIEMRDDAKMFRKKFPLVDSSDPEIRQLGNYFNNTFGIGKSFWDRFCFTKKENEIWMASSEWLNRSFVLETLMTHRLGIRLARLRREGEWKLATNAAQLLAAEIKTNRVDLLPEEVEAFASAGTIRRKTHIEQGPFVAYSGGLAIGCGVIHQGALKSQMPRSRMVIGVDF